LIRAEPDGISFDVLVTPRASRAKLGPVHGDRIKIAVTSPPVDGEANAAVIELIAASLRVPKSSVTITAGASSRRKTVRVRGSSVAALEAIVSA
jgi:uncharacterized protein (TIGR00251 family)